MSKKKLGPRGVVGLAIDHANRGAMKNDLYAVALADASVICSDCAQKMFPDGNFPDDSTPVFWTDIWKYQVTGNPCAAGCGCYVGEDG